MSRGSRRATVSASSLRSRLGRQARVPLPFRVQVRHGAKINSRCMSPGIPVAVHKHFVVSPTHGRKHLTA